MYRIVDEYQGLFRNAPPRASLVSIEEDFEKYILRVGKEQLVNVNSFYLAASTVGTHVNGSDAIVAWFNNQPYHTSPLSLNLIHNAAVRAILGQDHSIRVINHPLPFTVEQRRQILQMDAGSNIGFQLASNLTFAMAFVSAFYVLFYIKV